MKAKTKIQIKVYDLSITLNPIKEHVNEWAYINCLDHKGFSTKTKVLCLDCGESFPKPNGRKVQKCVNCGTKITVKESRNTTDNQINYFGTAEVIGEFQVIRNFKLTAFYKKGQLPEYNTQEILQYWVASDGKYQMIGLNHHTQGYCDSWGGEMEIRKENSYYSYNQKYNVHVDLFHPKSVFKDQYLRYGINSDLQGLSFLKAIELVPSSPKLETIVKAKQWSLATQLNGSIYSHWDSIKICIRNKYLVADGSIWMDYIDLLRYFGKDLRNPKYVCPKDLKKEHDRFMLKKRAKQKKIDFEIMKSKIEKSQKAYLKEKEKFFDLEFKKGSIVVAPLKEVKEFLDEGDSLKHCVFTNEYYKKEDSLILSARIKNKPIETIEISLSKMTVVQSRGKGNKATKYNETILSLVNSNLHRIRAVMC